MSVNINHQLNTDWKGPITQCVMLDPVTTRECKHTFDHLAIQRWMDRGRTNCPLCRKQITKLEHNHQMRTAIHKFIIDHPFLFNNKTPQMLLKELIDSYDLEVETALPEFTNLYHNNPLIFQNLTNSMATVHVQVRTVQMGNLGEQILVREYTGDAIDRFVRDNFQEHRQVSYALSIGHNYMYIAELSQTRNYSIRSLAAVVTAIFAVYVMYRLRDALS